MARDLADPLEPVFQRASVDRKRVGSRAVAPPALTLFGGGFLVDLLRTHPKLLLGGLVLENPHYIPPEQLATAPA